MAQHCGQGSNTDKAYQVKELLGLSQQIWMLPNAILISQRGDNIYFEMQNLDAY